MPVRVKKLRNKKPKRTAKGPVLSEKAFAAISAVEGLKMSTASKRRLKALRSRELSPNELRAELLRVHRDIEKRR